MVDILTGLSIDTEYITDDKQLLSGDCVPSLKYIYDFKNAFSKCARTYMDKNGGAGILMCPQLLWTLNNKTFNGDTDHYVHRVDNTCDSSMAIFKTNYTRLLLDDVQNFNTKKSVPYAYILQNLKTPKG